MSVSQHQEGDRTRLDGFEIDIFNLVREEATSEQWKEWLRVPLEHAVAKGNMDLFTRLMEAGADGSAGWRGCNGRTLLGSAAGVRSEEIVLALLKAGAKSDLDVKFGERSESALHVAAAEGADAVFATLIRAGADPDLQDGKGCSPLHVAAEAGRHGMVRELLLKGASPNTRVRMGNNTPLHLAAQQGNRLCVSELLLAGADIDSHNEGYETPLFLAAASDQLGAVDELLAAGANPDRRESSNNMSPLDKAAACGHEDTVGVFLRHGVDINACDTDGNTALHFACYDRDNSGMVRMLIAAGAHTEVQAEYRMTPLHVTADTGRSSTGIMHALLEGRADVNALDESNFTPLHLACVRSDVPGVRFLLGRGADETRMDENGKTPADKLISWEQEYGCPDHEGRFQLDDFQDYIEQRNIQHQCIRRMLARAPADRSWRRRGWLVLCRDPTLTKVQLSTVTSGGGTSATVTMSGCDSRRGDDENCDKSVDDVGPLVGRVVDLKEEGIFRLVVGFL